MAQQGKKPKTKETPNPLARKRLMTAAKRKNGKNTNTIENCTATCTALELGDQVALNFCEGAEVKAGKGASCPRSHYS